MPSFSLISMNQFAIKISSVGQADGAFVFSFPTSLRGVGPECPYGPEAAFRLPNSIMVGVAQLVEPQVVALVVVGSSPITHPIKNLNRAGEVCPVMCFRLNPENLVGNQILSSDIRLLISDVCHLYSELCLLFQHAPVAQLDRAPDFESLGQG